MNKYLKVSLLTLTILELTVSVIATPTNKAPLMIALWMTVGAMTLTIDYVMTWIKNNRKEETK